MTRIQLAAAILMVLATLGSAPGAVHKSSSNYSIACPDNWVAASADERAQIDRRFAPVGGDKAAVDACFYRPGRDGILVVVVCHEAMEVREQDLPKVCAMLELRLIGMAGKIVQSSVMTFSGRPCFSLIVDARPFGSSSWRQWMIIGSSGGKTFMFILESPLGRWTEVQSDFPGVVKSIKLPDGLFDWFRDMGWQGKVMVIALPLAAIVALVVGLSKWRRGPARSMSAFTVTSGLPFQPIGGPLDMVLPPPLPSPLFLRPPAATGPPQLADDFGPRIN